MKYLITDDSKMGRKIVMKELRAYLTEDDEVLQAENGAIAVDMYKEHQPDICFMDLTMPVMDGFEATKAITEFDSTAKVFVVSADVQKGAVDQAIANGAVDFIKKPLDAAKIEKILKDMGVI